MEKGKFILIFWNIFIWKYGRLIIVLYFNPIEQIKTFIDCKSKYSNKISTQSPN